MKYLVSFADDRLKKSLKRLSEQGRNTGIFDDIYMCSNHDISQSLRSLQGEHLRRGVRGFGYWCWKPDIILARLSSLQEDDSLLYLDVGCHINAEGLPRLYDYFDKLSESRVGILGFQAKPPTEGLVHDGRYLPDLAERKWTKGDLLDHFGVRHRSDIVNSPQIGSGIMLFRKCTEAVSLIEQWASSARTNMELFDDTPSKSPNLPGFVEHRHDQSYFSILCKLNDVPTLSAYEYWYPKKDDVSPDWEALRNCPIHARRDKDYGFPFRYLYAVQRRFQSYVPKTRLRDL